MLFSLIGSVSSTIVSDSWGSALLRICGAMVVVGVPTMLVVALMQERGVGGQTILLFRFLSLAVLWYVVSRGLIRSRG
jgi:hypothetical protein